MYSDPSPTENLEIKFKYSFFFVIKSGQVREVTLTSPEVVMLHII